MSRFDNRQKEQVTVDPNKNEANLDKASMPEQNRDAVRRSFVSADQRKGAEVLKDGIRDRSNDAGRDAVLDPGRIARPQMMAMVSVVFPELSTSTSPQRDAFVKAFENPAFIRSYLINPEQTASHLAARFPDLQDSILKNRPFERVGTHLEVNPASGLYQRVLQEVESGVKPSNSFVRKEMDNLLSSAIGARLGGSMGMETKAYELIRNRIESQGQFNKKGAIIEADIGRLMNSPQARQDLKEVEALAKQGPLPGLSTAPQNTPSGGIPVQGGAAIDPSQLSPVPTPTSGQAQSQVQNPGNTAPLQGGGAINLAGLTPVSTTAQAPAADLPSPGPSSTNPAQPQPVQQAQANQTAGAAGTTPAATPPAAASAPAGASPAAPAQAGATPAAPAGAPAAAPGSAAAPGAAPAAAGANPATPPAAGAAPAANPSAPAAAPKVDTPPQPTNQIEAQEQMYKDNVAVLEAQAKQRANPPSQTPVTPAPSEEVKQLQQQNKDLNDRLSKLEASFEQTLKKNAELEKKNAELEKKNAELEKKIAELEKKAGSAPAPAATPEKKEDKQALSYEETRDKAKALYDAMNGLGTDEAALLKALSQLDKEGQKKVADFYAKTYNADLDEDIKAELSGTDLAIAQKLREGAALGTAEAVQIFSAVNGLGTEENAIRVAIKDKTPEEMKAIASEYQRLTGESLEQALRGDLSGAELKNALKSLNTGEVEQLASKLYTAMDGFGTDEDEVLRTLAPLDSKQQAELSEAYKRLYGVDLDKDLAGDFSGATLSAVKKLREGSAAGTAEAVGLYLAMDGVGTDEKTVQSFLKDKTPEEASGIASEYRRIFNSSLEDDLKGDLSGAALEEALAPLRGPAYDLHDLIESDKIATPEGYSAAKKSLSDDPKVVEEYTKRYGKDPAQAIEQSPALQRERSRREAAKKILEQTQYLDQ